MARSFSGATAEQVLLAAEAVVAFSKPIDARSVAGFADVTEEQAKKALALSVDLGLLNAAEQKFSVSNPICRLLRTPHEQERAAVLRIVLENYEPFYVFREELEACGDASIAARRTKEILEIDAHREEIKDTLLNLATFSGALVAAHGGRYSRSSSSITGLIVELSQGCQEVAGSLQYVRDKLGAEQANTVSHNDVLVPVAAALRHALADSPREAVLHAGNAVESFLAEYGRSAQVDLNGKHGINSKIDELQRQQKLSKKLAHMGKYLGHVRNGADHGVDQDVNAAWEVSTSTGMNYIGVALSFIRSTLRFRQNIHEL